MDIYKLIKKIDPLGFSIGYEEPSSVITMKNRDEGDAYMLKENVDDEFFFKTIMSSKNLSKDFLLSFFKPLSYPDKDAIY